MYMICTHVASCVCVMNVQAMSDPQWLLVAVLVHKNCSHRVGNSMRDNFHAGNGVLFRWFATASEEPDVF